MPALTIAAAARHCGVARRTLQRAIKAGRLTLTADHQLTLEALAEAGYAAAATPQGHAPAAPLSLPLRHAPGATTQLSQILAHLARIEAHLARQVAHLETLCALLTPQGQAAAAPRPSQRHAAEALSPAPLPSPQVLGLYDPAAAVARMQTLQAQGLSLAQIAAQLTAEGIATRHGHPWHKGTVGYLLQQANRER